MISCIKIQNVVKSKLKTSYGPFSLYCFSIANDFNNNEFYNNQEHLALVLGEEKGWSNPVPVRVNSACITSEVFHCQRCDCKWQLDRAMELIAEKGQGIITYHTSHEGRGFGLAAKLQSYNLMDEGIDSASSYIKLGHGTDDKRDYRVAACILNYFGINEITMLGNNRRKIESLEGCGIKVINRVPLIYNGEQNDVKSYLNKKAKESVQDLLREYITV